ncbi:MAG: gluconate 2-dehydrogenase subunit 3 family protein [Acidobacteria bacterium]|nr:gluconate 2-dehydrogenase subunit 3 family protein [Acidobacteriota bacterium]
MSRRRTRRELLKNIGMSVAFSGLGVNAVTPAAAQHVHQAVSEEKAKGVYKPKAFTAAEYRALRRLCELVIPADEKSKGALETGAPEFIDLLAANNAELARIFTGGIGWLDARMRKQHGAAFADASPEQQTALLDVIAYRKNETPELAPGIRFFAWVRNMTVDAFYTSRIGMDDLGFMGNSAVSQFSVPVEAIQYAVRRSGLS